MMVLALEASTSSAKAIVYDLQAGVVDVATAHYSQATAAPGQQHANALHEELLQLGKKVAQGKEIASIALCSSWHSVMLLDSAFEPVTPIYTWEHNEAAELSKIMRQDKVLTETLYRRTGCIPNTTYPRQTLLALKKRGLELERYLIASQGAYSFYRMTGEFAETINVQSGSGLLNLDLLTYDDFVLNMLGIKKTQLGQLVTYKDTAPLNHASAKKLGVKSGIPVVAAHSDGACNQVGSFCASPNMMTLSVGTSGAIRLTQDRPLFSDNLETWSYYGVDSYICGAAINGATNCIEWFKNVFLLNQMNYEELEGNQPISLKELPIFLPFLFGERCPGWKDNRLAGFTHVNANHGISEFYLAIQMGILFSLLSCYQPLVKICGKPKEIVVSGGILHSKRWTQMLADIFEHDMLCVENIHASAIGASVLAMHAAGVYPDIRTFSKEYETAKLVRSDASKLRAYQTLYDKYIQSYQAS